MPITNSGEAPPSLSLTRFLKSMLRLRRAAWGGRALVAFAEFAAEEIQREAVALQRELGIEARAFVAEEGVRTVELVPREVRAGRFECGVDFHAAFERDVRILAPQNHQQLALDFGD